MKRLLTLFLSLMALASIAVAQPLVQPFDFVMPTYDSTHSEWLPEAPTEAAGKHGFLKTSSDGHLRFTDGTPVRFTGVGLILTSCFPDSLTAIATAKRLRKLGINMVRFDYMDYVSYELYSTIATGTRSDTLSPSQMRKLDFFLHQLKQRGIYAHFVLKSLNMPRSGDGVPGWDSVYLYGQHLAPFSDPIQRMQRAYCKAFFNHVNPFTGLRYADDPEIALITISDRSTPYYYWMVDYLSATPGILSYQHSRMIDTLFTSYLTRKYGSTSTMRDAYWEGVHAAGSNVVVNPGFESFTSDWTLTAGEGANASAVIVQGTDVPAGEGSNSMRVVITRSSGVESGIYLYQLGMSIKQNHIYRLAFKGKTDTASGRTLRIIIVQGTGYGYTLDTTVALTTAWQSYSAIFRAPGIDSLNTGLYIFAGASNGDIYLDGFALQETGRAGLKGNESLEAYNVERAKFTLAPKYSRQRIIDQAAFYDSVSRTYFRTMQGDLRSLGVQVPIAGTNLSITAADSWTQSEYDFTSNYAFWDNMAARAGLPYSDSTWVINNYSVLNYADQKIPELTHSVIAGKPFIAEAYDHVFPNAHRSEMMLYYPAYAMLQDWDGAYFYLYSDGATDSVSRRSIVKSDYWSIVSDPSICALLPQFSAIIRNGWIAPAQRTLNIQHDEAELRTLPLTYSTTSGNTYNINISDGGYLDNVSNMVSRVRLDSFNASRHYTAGDYYFTVPTADNIASDTRQIVRDATKGIMWVTTPKAQGGSGAIASVGSIRTDDLRVNWIDGGKNVTYLWTTLDTASLKNTQRSLLTVTTRALNKGAIWQFGDSSLGNKWGNAPVQMESVKLGINFYTDADSLLLYPLDTTGRATGKIIAAEKTVDSWRVTLDLAAEHTPWFGVRQVFLPKGAGVDGPEVAGANAGEFHPNPASDEASIEVIVPVTGSHISADIVDMLGRVVKTVEVDARPGTSMLPIDVRELASGSYVCMITIGGKPFARRFVVNR